MTKFLTAYSSRKGEILAHFCRAFCPSHSESVKGYILVKSAPGNVDCMSETTLATVVATVSRAPARATSSR